MKKRRLGVMPEPEIPLDTLSELLAILGEIKRKAEARAAQLLKKRGR